MAARPKNVLLLWTDQQRADTVGPDKDPRLRMPHLERLAATGDALPAGVLRPAGVQPRPRFGAHRRLSPRAWRD